MHTQKLPFELNSPNETLLARNPMRIIIIRITKTNLFFCISTKLIRAFRQSFKHHNRSSLSNPYLDWKKRPKKKVSFIDRSLKSDGASIANCFIRGKKFYRIIVISIVNLLKTSSFFRSLMQNGTSSRQAKDAMACFFSCLTHEC